MLLDDRYDSLFKYYAEKSGVDWRLLKAQVKAESDFNPDAESAAGAEGLAQFMPLTWSDVAVRQLKLKFPNTRNPEHSIRAQAHYMSWLIKQLGDDLSAALAAYNCGIGNVKKAATAMGAAWKAGLPEETQNYLAKIETYYHRYQKELT